LLYSGTSGCLRGTALYGLRVKTGVGVVAFALLDLL